MAREHKIQSKPLAKTVKNKEKQRHMTLYLLLRYCLRQMIEAVVTMISLACNGTLHNLSFLMITSFLTPG